jgi:curved DNA-binding protein CbpA
MKLPNLSKITKITKNIKFPKFSINIKMFLMVGLLIFYLVIIISHFLLKTFENFNPKDRHVIRGFSGNIKKQSDINSKNSLDNYNIMTKLIPDIQKNIIDLSSNLHGIESKIAGIQPSSLQPIDASSNPIIIRQPSGALNPIGPIDLCGNVIIDISGNTNINRN